MKITNSDIQTERQGPRCRHSNERYTQGIKTYTHYIKHNVQISKKYKKKPKYTTMYNLLKMAVDTCLQAITRQTKRVLVIIYICRHPIRLFFNKYICSKIVEISENISKFDRKNSSAYRIIKLYIHCLEYICQHKMYVVENIFFPTQKKKEVIDITIPKKQITSVKLRDKIIETKKVNGEPVYTNIKIICVNIAGKLESRVE